MTTMMQFRQQIARRQSWWPMLLLPLLGWPAGRLLLVSLLWLTVPGALLLDLLQPAGLRHRLLRLVVSWALSLSLLATVSLWLTLLRLPLTDTLRWLLLSALTALWLWRTIRAPAAPLPPLRLSMLFWPLLLTTTALLRMQQIDGLALPAWVDAPQHALLVRVAAEQGYAPLDLRPYLAVTDLPYHWGYHVWLAQVWRTSGVELSDALLWSGQLLNWLQVPASAALALALWRRQRAAAAAAVIVGLVSAMPAYYVSWSRYTQLAGLLMLPGLAIVFDSRLRHRQHRLTALTLLIAVGLLLVHVRIALFALLLLLVQLALALRGRRLRRELRHSGRLLAAFGFAAVALLLPWLRILVERRLAPAAAGTAPLTGGGPYNELSPGLLWAGFNEWLVPAALLLALLLALFAAGRRKYSTVVIVGWTVLLVLITYPLLLGLLLPAVGLALAGTALLYRRWRLLPAAVLLLAANRWTIDVQPLWLLPVDILLISLFLPISQLFGGAAALLGDLPLDRRLRAGAALLLLAGSLVAGWSQRTIINPVTVLADADDRAALTWIAAQTPADARFLVNAAAWLPGVPRLNDGGGWITPLTGRWSSLPPVTFVYADAAAQAQVRSAAALVRNVDAGRLAALETYLRTASIDYVYSSARGPLTAQLLGAVPLLQPVFTAGDVVIFRVR